MDTSLAAIATAASVSPLGITSSTTPPIRRQSADEAVLSPRNRHSFHSTGASTFRRSISSASSAATPDYRQVSWTEFTARKSVVKFRNRKSVSSRSRHGSGEGACSSAPSALVQQVLRDQYEICREQEERLASRIMAVFYCWFFGWVMDVYGALTNSCTDHSFWRWVLSCLMVTGTTLLVTVLAAMGLHASLMFLALLLRDAVNYLLLISGTFVCLICTIAIINYK